MTSAWSAADRLDQSRPSSRVRLPASSSARSSLIGRAQPSDPDGLTVSGSNHDSKICRKIHCVQR